MVVQYTFKRIVHMVVILLGVTFLTFALTSMSPSDAAEMTLSRQGVAPTAELLEATREKMGLHDPFIIQYVNWLKGVLQGDFGTSFQHGDTVFAQMSRRIPQTIKLTLLSTGVMIIFALPLGILSAIYKNKPIDYIIRFTSFIGIAMPNFWLGLILMLVFGVMKQWLPVMSDGSLKSSILPVATLAIPMICRYARQIRVAILEEMSSEYVIGARARGVKELDIILKNVLPNCVLPVITLLGLSIGGLLGGTAIIESIFSWPGVGRMAIDAITVRDYPVIQAYVIWMTIIYVFINLGVDLLNTLLDPHKSTGGRKKYAEL
ncbi:binding-protein-dependent transport systems inner membrane component [Alkaliphilus metalliredigens QYMF]|uniref:Nickel import system permease protein NikB n=1 Tax=Alkaliphilus metalliredigens (strain QYMF) TaxID=293826 RepID=A6TPQ0_ALKMQ|nr:nickel ABC transporter permease [Alkaliphilus metalliredigens]ABR48168.1 binding-protein-dependent transport systems inner membrane component [Alkaliphilus metalliredigens QYMF]